MRQPHSYDFLTYFELLSNLLSTTEPFGYGGVTFDLTLKGQIKDQVIKSMGRTVVLKGVSHRRAQGSYCLNHIHKNTKNIKCR